MMRDIFLCHASADKASIARPLYQAFTREGISVWFDEAEIAWGDPVVSRIQQGLGAARFVLVLITPNFVAPGGNWRNEELQSSLAEQIHSGITRVLPLVSGLSHDQLIRHLPFIAGRRYERFDNVSAAEEIVIRLRERIAASQHSLALNTKTSTTSRRDHGGGWNYCAASPKCTCDLPKVCDQADNHCKRPKVCTNFDASHKCGRPKACKNKSHDCFYPKVYTGPPLD